MEETKLQSQQRLAADRTHLANERTLLAYVRTSLSMVGFGVIILRFDPSPNAIYIGWGFMIAALVVQIIGATRFYVFKRKIEGDAI